MEYWQMGSVRKVYCMRRFRLIIGFYICLIRILRLLMFKIMIVKYFFIFIFVDFFCFFFLIIKKTKK